MNRAHSTLEIKSTGTAGGRRQFSGVASTPSTDRMGDIVEPKGAKFKLPMPFLWQHDSGDPIGWVTSAKVTDKGITIDGEVADVANPGPLKDRLSMAWDMLTSKLVRGLSIGFSPLDAEPINAKDPWGPTRFKLWEWLELSAVTIPANQDASISVIRSIDASLLAASGRKQAASTVPGASGKQPGHEPNSPRSPKGNQMKTMQEVHDERGTKAARMNELTQAFAERQSTDEEAGEFDTLAVEVKQLDDKIRKMTLDAINVAKAKPIADTNGGSRNPAGYVFTKAKDKEEKFKGETGLKRAMCNVLAMSEVKQGRFVTPVQLAETMWGKTNPTLVAVMKTAVPGAGTDSGEWGAELAAVDNRYTGDFIEYLYGLTIFDQLPLRRVPHNVAIKGQDGAFTGFFVGQSKGIPVSAGDFSSASTVAYKAAGLCVVSNEWLRDASGDGLALCGQGLREAVAQAVDSRFLSTTAVSAGVAPAGILNGLSAIASNGGDSQSIATDIRALFAPFISAKNLSGGLAWVMTPTTAVSLSLMRNALGQPEYPTINGNGGTFMGYPVYIGDNVGSGDVILLKPSDIWKIGDLGVSLSTSDSAMIEQDTVPTGATDTPVAASATMVSMFQEDSTAIKVVRPISWGKRRASAVAYVGDAAYGTEQS